MSEDAAKYNDDQLDALDNVPIDALVESIKRVESRLEQLREALATRLEAYTKLAGVATTPAPVKRRKRIPVPVVNPETGQTVVYRGGRRPAWLTDTLLSEAKARVTGD